MVLSSRLHGNELDAVPGSIEGKPSRGFAVGDLGYSLKNRAQKVDNGRLSECDRSSVT